MQLNRAALVIVVLAALGVCVSSSAILADVFKKMEDFATGTRLVSGVTKSDLIALVDAWNVLPEEKRAKLLETPQFKLLYHFGIVPTERIRDQLADVVIAVAHIHRLEKAYKRFRPAYLGKPIESGTLGNLKLRKVESIFVKLSHRKACTLKDFELVNMEHTAWLARFEDIVNHEDVYVDQDEMRNILNYHNHEVMKPLYDHVLPLIGRISDPAKLQQIYYDKLYETANIQFVDGKPVRYV